MILFDAGFADGPALLAEAGIRHLRLAQPAQVALPYLKRLYRTQLSRGMKSCSIICVDDETRYFLESRILG